MGTEGSGRGNSKYKAWEVGTCLICSGPPRTSPRVCLRVLLCVDMSVCFPLPPDRES